MPRLLRPPRAAPTPAAAVTCAALGTFALTYALLSWNDTLDQAAQGDWAWPLGPGAIARASATWTAWVALWCVVAWVVGRRHPWRVPVLSAVVVGGWTVLAWISVQVSYLVTGWYVPWPGPVPGTAYGEPADTYPYELATVLRPGVVTPVVVVAAVAATSWLAHRRSRREPPATAVTTTGARRTAVAVLVLPVVAALVAGSLLQLAPADDYSTTGQRWVAVLVSPAFTLALAVGAALLLGGSGRAGWVLLGPVWLACVGPLVLRWWSGEADTLLGTTALGTVAMALAAAVHPLATALSRLDEPRPDPVGPSVPERADAHH